jgi:hypothetical protein
MTVKIITGTIMGKDVFGGIAKLRKEGFFYQWYYTKKGWGSKKSKIISGDRGVPGSLMSNMVQIVQTTGSGKTLLAALELFLASQKGDKTAANMPFSFLSKEIDSFEEFQSLEGYKILLDDIRHVIASFGGKEAKISSEMANSSRKKMDTILITTQRLENFVPPDIRMIADEIHVPYVRCFDTLRRSPDGRFMPLELCDLRFSAGLEFLDMKRYNLTGKTGTAILNSFNTMNISTKLE